MASTGSAIEEPTSTHPGSRWMPWNATTTTAEIEEMVQAFEPVAPELGGAEAAAYLKGEAFRSPFTVTRLLMSDERVEGFITCRVSEARLTWSGVRALVGKDEDPDRTL